jgi:hypothetical protein
MALLNRGRGWPACVTLACSMLAAASLGCSGVVVIAPDVASDRCFPRMWEPRPAGVLPIGTRSTTMTLHTDRAAICRWGEIEGWVYVDLPHRFDVTGGTEHSTKVSGLSDGAYYRLYAKCETADNACATPHDLIFFFFVER